MSKYDPHRFPYEWYMRDGYPAKGIEKHGCKVFGTFICGGGSSMGYKLAGFHHLGGVELDPRVAEIYNANHHPQYLYNMDIRDFNKLQDLPDDLYNLDLLDGSPPCSTFSTAGSRDKAWGKEKKFAEGQKKQTLDDLVFVYCDTILKLQPKCFLLENVSGLVKGNAKSYAKRIVQYMEQNGYVVQVFLLNAAQMGVPQKRERVFFIGRKKELRLPNLVLDFNEEPILFRDITEHDNKGDINSLSEQMQFVYQHCKPNDVGFDDVLFRETGRQTGFGQCIYQPHFVAPTVTTGRNTSILAQYPRRISRKEISLCGSYPLDYKCESKNKLEWLIGMSVPPVMTAQIAYQIYKQWLSKINK
jgi:DNA (cytosine-5)-methyltransferase 1